ncbi:senescence-associated protein-domain-containing protein [Tirmania nivea]|nr:senescence-associated protein-domain-containing protein [Tirmania nivea]
MDQNGSNACPPEKGGMIWSNDNSNTLQRAPYDPSRWATPSPQEDRAGERTSLAEGTLVLVDENGNQVGVLGEHINIADVVPGSQEPVEIDLSRTDGVVTVRSIQADYLNDSQDPAYANSRLVGTAATAARVLVTGATYVAKAVEAGARTFTEKSTPVNTPMTFQPTTHNYVRQIHNYSAAGASIASKTVGTVTHHAQNLGAKLAGKGEGHQRSSNPGLINKGLIAFGTIADGIDHASRLILTTSSQAATTMAGHRYGAEAEEVARGLTGVVKNVGLVYVDASGISRRAVVKSVAKGMVVGRVKGGGEVVFQGNNSSQAVLTQPGPRQPGILQRPQGQFQSFTPPLGQQGQFYGSGKVNPEPPQYRSGKSSPISRQHQFSPPPQQHSSPQPQQQQFSPRPQQHQYPPPLPTPQYNNAPFKY